MRIYASKAHYSRSCHSPLIIPLSHRCQGRSHRSRYAVNQKISFAISFRGSKRNVSSRTKESVDKVNCNVAYQVVFYISKYALGQDLLLLIRLIGEGLRHIQVRVSHLLKSALLALQATKRCDYEEYNW